MTAPPFELQGHRGARGRKPENTLPSFEAALDAGASAAETDVHVTADGVPLLFHDHRVTARICRDLPGARVPAARQPAVIDLTLAELRGYRADRNPAPEIFPGQDAGVTPLAEVFARERQIDPYAIPTLADLFAFCDAYSGLLGRQAGKTAAQQENAQRFRFDLELKRVPFRPEIFADGIDGSEPGRLERLIVEAVRAAGVVGRTTVRSFDHRSVRAVGSLEPALTTAVLIVGTCPVAPAELVRRAGAQVYCPEVEFLAEGQVRELHADGLRVIPWTVNDADDWRRLLDWGVDGITTDYPDRLAELLRGRALS
jgi:glycerophosphoryl diester phosphodiesterase